MTLTHSGALLYTYTKKFSIPAAYRPCYKTAFTRCWPLSYVLRILSESPTGAIQKDGTEYFPVLLRGLSLQKLRDTAELSPDTPILLGFRELLPEYRGQEGTELPVVLIQIKKQGD